MKFFQEFELIITDPSDADSFEFFMNNHRANYHIQDFPPDSKRWFVWVGKQLQIRYMLQINHSFIIKNGELIIFNNKQKLIEYRTEK